MSKYLKLPVGATPSSPKVLPRARLLTTSDALAEVEEKERKQKPSIGGERAEQRQKTHNAINNWQCTLRLFNVENHVENRGCFGERKQG